jgi:hypothetical protein
MLKYSRTITGVEALPHCHQLLALHANKLQGSTGEGHGALPHVPLLQVLLQLAGRPTEHAVPSGNGNSSQFPAVSSSSTTASRLTHVGRRVGT